PPIPNHGARKGTGEGCERSPGSRTTVSVPYRAVGSVGAGTPAYPAVYRPGYAHWVRARRLAVAALLAAAVGTPAPAAAQSPAVPAGRDGDGEDGAQRRRREQRHLHVHGRDARHPAAVQSTADRPQGPRRPVEVPHPARSRSAGRKAAAELVPRRTRGHLPRP